MIMSSLLFAAAGSGDAARNFAGTGIDEAA
jgi:hypothetical protein